jgi:hypothetical protein
MVGAPPFAISSKRAWNFLTNSADGFPIGNAFPPSIVRNMPVTDGDVLKVLERTLASYGGDWSLIFRHILLKIYGVIGSFEVPDNIAFRYGIEISPVLGVLLNYTVLLPLGIAGLVLVLRRRRKYGPLLALTAFVLGRFFLVAVHARYRLTWVALLMIFAAAGLAEVVRHGRKLYAARDRRGSLTKAWLVLPTRFAVVALVASLTQLVFLPLHFRSENARIGAMLLRFSEYRQAARAYAFEGRFDRAEDELSRYEAAVADLTPQRRQEAAFEEANLRAIMASDQLQRGRHAEARLQAMRAERRLAPYRGQAEACFVLGAIHQIVRDFDRGRLYYECFLRENPTGPRAASVRKAIGRMSMSIAEPPALLPPPVSGPAISPP